MDWPGFDRRAAHPSPTGVNGADQTAVSARRARAPWHAASGPEWPARAHGDGEAPPGADARRARVLLWHLGRAGAGAKFTAELAKEMRANPGLEIAVAASRRSELEERSRALGLPTYAAPTFEGDKSAWRGKASAALGLARLPALTRGFRRLLAEGRIDVAMCTMPAVWDVAVVAALSRVPTRLVLVLHDAFLHPGDEYPMRQAILHRNARSADALVVLSDHVREQAVNALGYPAERVWKMPHGAFAYGDAPRPASHPRGARPLRLLFFGRIMPYKGLSHLLRACRALQEEGVPTDLTIAGSGNLEPYAGLLDRLHGVQVHNRWLDDAEIGSFMAASDFAVLPYTEASQSGVAATAYAAGRPVVATPVGGLAEQVIHGATGLLARDMSVEALADALRAFIEAPALLDRCAAGALDHAKGPLSWRRSAEVAAEAISAVLAAPRRGGR